MLNILFLGTQIPIHRHNETTETVIAYCDLCSAEGQFGIQIPQGIWHTIIVSEPCFIFESKDGAYKPLTSDDVWNNEDE